MKSISFDLDDTLIGNDWPVEPVGLMGRLFGVERLRQGTRRLFKNLNDKGYSVSIYTTSLRSRRCISKIFRCHGIRIDRIINGDNQEHLSHCGHASKRPDLFGFSIHVDDAPIGTCDTENFRVLLVKKTDRLWVETLLNDILKPNL